MCASEGRQLTGDHFIDTTLDSLPYQGIGPLRRETGQGSLWGKWRKSVFTIELCVSFKRHYGEPIRRHGRINYARANTRPSIGVVINKFIVLNSAQPSPVQWSLNTKCVRLHHEPGIKDDDIPVMVPLGRWDRMQT